MLQYFVIIGALVQLSGIGLYIKDTLAGKTKPNKISWLMWTAAPMIATAAALSSGVRWVILPTFMAGFGPLLVLIFSFYNPNSYWKLSRNDYLCGLFSLIALVAWALTHNPLYAIIFSLVSDGLAAIPTIIKSWRFPESESPWAYAGGIFSNSLAFLAIQHWGFNEFIFPVYFVSVNIIIIFSIIHRKLFKA